MFDFLGGYEDLAAATEVAAPAVFSAAGDSMAAYNDGSAMANAADFQEWAPTEYDYTALAESLGLPGAPQQEMITRAGDSQASYADGSAYSTKGMTDSGSTGKGALSMWDKLLKGVGVTDKNGAFDLSNPKTLDAMMKLIIGGGSMINALAGGNKPKGYQSAQQMRDQVAGPYDRFNPQQQEWASKFFNSPSQPRGVQYSADMRSPVKMAQGGALSHVMGPGGGQDDIVDAKLAPGEFVWDADTVSMLGDGNNDQGAAMLDEMRQNLRQFKRSAPPDQIPPPTGDPMRFLPRGALSMMEAGHGGA